MICTFRLQLKMIRITQLRLVPEEIVIGGPAVVKFFIAPTIAFRSATAPTNPLAGNQTSYRDGNNSSREV